MLLAPTRGDPHRLATMASPTGIFLIDAGGELTFANPRLLEMAGVPESTLLGLGFLRFIHPADRDAAAIRIAGQLVDGESARGDLRLTCGRRRDAWVRVWTAGIRDEEGTITGLAGVLEDITEARREEARTRAAEARQLGSTRLTSLGDFAGGVAHDFNNLLVGIMGNASLAQLDVPAGSDAAAALADLQAATERATQLTAQLLAYAGRGSGPARAVPVNAVAEEAYALVRTTLPARVRVTLRLGADLPPVHGEAARLRQAVANLLTNAAESLGNAGGEIVVRTRCADADEALRGNLAIDGGLAAGRHVALEVSDKGAGMDAATLARAFDPFFSTKPRGKGLGLAAVVGAVRAYAGGVHVRTAPGAGSAFTLLLPPEPAAPRATAPAAAPPAAVVAAGTVLVVDDERSVRDVMRRVLARAGFEVLEAADGASAVQTYTSAAGRVGCVLLDLSMPGIDGAETFRRLREVDPEARVVLTSGHCEQDVAELFPPQGLAGFLQKPYDLASLLRITKAVVAS